MESAYEHYLQASSKGLAFRVSFLRSHLAEKHRYSKNLECDPNETHSYDVAEQFAAVQIETTYHISFVRLYEYRELLTTLLSI